MPWNREKNTVFNVGFPKESETLHKLLQEAREIGITPGKLIALKIYQSYTAGAGSSLPSPVVVPSTPRKNEEPLVPSQVKRNVQAYLGNSPNEKE